MAVLRFLSVFLLSDPLGLIDNALPSGKVSNLTKRPQESKAVLDQLGIIIIGLVAMGFQQTRPFGEGGI